MAKKLSELPKMEMPHGKSPWTIMIVQNPHQMDDGDGKDMENEQEDMAEMKQMKGDKCPHCGK